MAKRLKLSLSKKVLEYVSIVLVAVLLAFNYVLFIVPNNFAPAGLNGIATMLQYKLGFSIGYFSLIINVPLCVFAYFLIDKDFAVKCLVFCLTYSGVYLVLQQIDFTNLSYNAHGIDTVFPCLIAGILSGLVYGVCFRANSSTGGTDIVAKYINKKYPAFSLFWIIFAINAVVAVSSLFVYGSKADGSFILDYKPVCLCVLYCFTSTFMGNKILEGYKTAYKFIIITPHAEDIEKDILTKLRHSATRLEGTGAYSHENKEVLLCVVNKHQITDLKNILKNYPQTFSFVETVNETVGNFKKIK